MQSEYGGLEHYQVSTLRKGFIFGVFTGALTFAPGILALEMSFVKVLFVIVFPLFLSWKFVPNRRFALSNLLVPVVLAETLLGGRGNWISMGGFSGRQILFFFLLATWFIDNLVLRARWPRGWITSYVLLVGGLAPVFWLFWSLSKGATVADALGDVNFLVSLALYFPLFLWFQIGPPLTWIKNYIAGLLLVLGVIFIIAPFLKWFTKWDMGVVIWFSGNITYFPNGFPRFSFNADVFFPVGIWLGFLTLFPQRRNQAKVRSTLLVGISTLALVLSFGRALWLSFLIASLMAFMSTGILALTRRILRRLLLATLFVLGVGVLLMMKLSPEGFARFFVLDDRSNMIRAEQSAELISAWLRSPLLGNGFGIILPSGYVRSQENPFLFELQYHSLLFKAGLIGVMLVLTIPLTAFCGMRSAVRRIVRSFSVSPGCALLVSASVGVITVAIAGAFNPYLTSFYFGFLSALTLAVYAYIKEEKHDLPHG